MASHQHLLMFPVAPALDGLWNKQGIPVQMTGSNYWAPLNKPQAGFGGRIVTCSPRAQLTFNMQVCVGLRSVISGGGHIILRTLHM